MRKPLEGLFHLGISADKEGVSYVMTMTQDQSRLLKSEVESAPARSAFPHDIAALNSLHGLRAVVLLGGSVRAGRLSGAIGRSMLDLPVESGRRVLELWQDQVSELAHAMGAGSLPLRVVVDQSSPAPTAVALRDGIQTQIERDPLDYRGTAGVLHDIARDYEDDDFLLVATGAQVLLEPLPLLVGALAAKGGDVTLIAHDDGIPSLA